MIYNEKVMDLFKVDNSYTKLQCISSDLKMGAGIAEEFQRRYGIREQITKMKEQDKNITNHPTAIRTGNVINMITKSRYWNKPTYETFTDSLIKVREIAKREEITKIATPIIGCGLDKLCWFKVRQIIQEVFEDTEIEVLVCMEANGKYKPQS